MDPFTLTENKVIEFVATTIIEHLIIKEGYNRIWCFFFPKEIYETRLMHNITKTIKEFEAKYPNNPEIMKFYNSEVIFSKLLDHIYFKTEYLNIVREEFYKQTNIEIPSTLQIREFFMLFISNVNNDKKLKKLHIQENYQIEIFNISEAICSIQKTISKVNDNIDYLVQEKKYENKIYTEDYIIQSLNKQVKKQLTKQTNSGKYLPNTYLEIGNQKDHLRIHCHPFLFSNKVFHEIGVYNFKDLDKSLKKHGKAGFSFDWHNQETKPNTLNFTNYISYTTNWIEFLKKKLAILNTFAEDGHSRYEYEFRYNFEDLFFLKSAVTLITEIAGQGKTNLLCDFVENFLVKHKIPCLFLTGNDLKSDDIRGSILKSLFPGINNISFVKLIDSINKICDSTSKFFVIIIDGLNENNNPKELSQNIESFLYDIVDYKFIKIVISCRTEYFDANFINLTNSSFGKKIQKITNLTVDRTDNSLKLKLFYSYFDYFNVTFDRISTIAYEQLVSNFLLLRIFCEAYQNTNTGPIDTIYKQELFQKYYEIKCEEINKRMDDDVLKISGRINLKEFFENIVHYMITNKQYFNVPLDNLIRDATKKDIYVRFLDENILIRRDMNIYGTGIFTEHEVVNFTFDEFRDFLISSYLIEKILPISVAQFEEFIQNELTEESIITEGCCTYLFYIYKKNNDSVLRNILIKQAWYKDVFAKCIFSVDDKHIDEDDKVLVKGYLNKKNKFAKYVINILISRTDFESHKVLNIEFLYETIRSFEGSDFNNFISMFEFEDQTRYQSYEKVNMYKIINILNDVLDDEHPVAEHVDKLFELMLYMFTTHWGYEARYVFERYYYQERDRSIKKIKNALKSNNQFLVKEINAFIEKYEIRI